MSIVEFKDEKYLRVDWLLGASKNNAIKFYTEVLDLLKQFIQNSPFIVYILEYMKHIPLYGYYKLPTQPNLNGNIFKNIFLPWYSHGTYGFPIKNSMVDNIDYKNEIKNMVFITKFLKMVVKDRKYIDVSIEDKQNVFYLFSKFGIKIQLWLNKTYYIPNHLIRNVKGFENNDYTYTIIITLDPRGFDFNDNFNVDIQQIKFLYNHIRLTLDIDMMNTNYINNMYYMINFSHNREYLNMGLEIVHPFFCSIIKQHFPIFYNIVPESKKIQITGNKMHIIYKTRASVVDQKNNKEIYTDIPEELDNVFVFVKYLTFRLQFNTVLQESRIIIGMRKK